MKRRCFFLAFSLGIFLSACATVEDAGQIASGRQALFTGNYPAALGYFQSAAQSNPNAVYGATLRLGVFTYLGQAQYLNGDTRKRASRCKRRFLRTSDNVARLYLGLTQARLGDRQTGLKNIQAGMSGIANFLNYLESNFSYSFGQFWDPGSNSRLHQERSRDDLKRQCRLAATN